MLQGTNIINFFSEKSNRRFDKDVYADTMPLFHTGYTPAFILASTEAIANATVKVISNIDDSEINSNNVIIETNVDGSVLSFAGLDTGGLDEGCYYLQLITDIGTFYSDVFGWVDDFSDMDVLKFEFQTTDLRMSGIFDLPYYGINFYFYLSYNGISFETEINEEGEEKPFGVLPVYNVASVKRTAEINGYNQIYRMLNVLRVVCTNGIIQLTDKDSQKYIYETEVNIKDSDSFGDTMIIEFTFKEYDFIAAKNEI